ncbi:MAG: hypothetical protein U1E63_01725 [Burkholderiales bacterium]
MAVINLILGLERRMFESAELGHVDKTTYKKEELKLREAPSQFDLHESGAFSVLLHHLRPGRRGPLEMVNVLKEWLIRATGDQGFRERTDDSNANGRCLALLADAAAEGRIGILFNGWYGEALVQRVLGNTSSAEFEHYSRASSITRRCRS